MAVALAGGCRVATLREGEPFVRGSIRVWQIFGRRTGAAHISLRTLELAPGSDTTLVNDACDDVWFVLDGGALLTFEGATHEVEPRTGIHLASRRSVRVACTNRAPLVIVSSRCPEPARPNTIRTAATRIGAISSGDAGRSVGESAPRGDADESVGERPPSSIVPIVKLASRQALPTGDRWYRVLVDDRVGCERVTQFVGSIPPGRAPDHFHNYEEVICVLRGVGRAWAGSTHTGIGPGSCIYLPRGQVHCVENTGTAALELMGVFYPAGSPAVRYDADSPGA